MRRKYSFTPILGWSISRYDKFSTCKRWYWYDYYAKKFDREVSPQKLSFLKSLTSTPLEIGNLVHDTIATQLHRIKKGSDPQDPSDLLLFAGYQIDRALAEKTFLEVYYGQRDTIDASELKAQVEICLRNFFTSSWYRWLTEDGIHRKSDWVIEPNDFGELRINGLKAYCKVDFLIPSPERKLYILDWKTGKADREKHRKQMTGYVAYAQDVFGADPRDIRPVVVYLGDSYAEMESEFNQNDMDEFVRQVKLQTEEMYSYCENIEENIPVDRDAFTPRFRKLCAYCNYQELCDA
ncbi:MAG: PD-(D/E)XK nuclease family protein [Dehalococcoidia bacterium]